MGLEKAKGKKEVGCVRRTRGSGLGALSVVSFPPGAEDRRGPGAAGGDFGPSNQGRWDGNGQTGGGCADGSIRQLRRND